MTEHPERASRFLALHQGERPLLLPNPWDRGSAVLLAALGFQALATTSSGFAATLGRPDGSVTRDEALGHAAAITAATDLPVTADLENGYADDPAGVAETVGLAAGTRLAGCSIEDYSGRPEPIYDVALATARVEAAAEAAHRGPARLVLTARAENHLHARPDLADTIARLQAYQEAGADVLYAPGMTRLDDIRRLVAAVDRPVNVLARPGVPPVPELATVGVSRVSVGGGSRSPASERSSRRPGSSRTRGPTGSGTWPASAPRPPAPPSKLTVVPESQQASNPATLERAEVTNSSGLVTPLCARLGITPPIVQPPIGSTATSELAAAVANAGGWGCWPSSG